MSVEEIKATLEEAAQAAIDSIRGGVEEAIVGAVTELRDRCNEFLEAQGQEVPVEPAGEESA